MCLPAFLPRLHDIYGYSLQPFARGYSDALTREVRGWPTLIRLSFFLAPQQTLSRLITSLIRRLRRLYGPGTWRKLKGNASVRLEDGSVRLAELHWYEAHGIGRHEYKIKRYLD